MMSSHLGVVNGGSDTIDRAWCHVCDMMVKIRCPGDLGRGICTWLCIDVFGFVWIMINDLGRCHMCVMINSEEC